MTDRSLHFPSGYPPIFANRNKLCRENFTRSTNSAIPQVESHHFEIEGRWSIHGNEESSKEACKEGG